MCRTIGTLCSYDYRTIASDRAAQRRFTTGALQDEFATGTAPALHSLAPKSQAIVQAKASPAAVEQLDGDKATVLVFLDQTVTSSLLKQPRYDRNRLLVTMRRADGGWLVAGIKAL